MVKFTYLAIDLLCVAFPLLASFEPRIKFWKKWPALFLGIGAMMLCFLPWDVIFTTQAIWGFNEKYLIGINFLGLPVEECLFFLFIPYSCMFLYEVMRHFIRKDVLGSSTRTIAAFLIGIFVFIGVMHFERSYTSITFFCTAILLYHLAFLRKIRWLGRFFAGYCVSLIPFFLVNGILTGSWIEEPIVWYNNAENTCIRIGTIPIEDGAYLMLMLLIVTYVYEQRLGRSEA
ncbi:MAG: lycopene cyclase domain-containing protein [Bacteroidota bacterium]|nr:lycopene cyclase domain-containing protein [Bacteroidota bacterium]